MISVKPARARLNHAWFAPGLNIADLLKADPVFSRKVYPSQEPRKGTGVEFFRGIVELYAYGSPTSAPGVRELLVGAAGLDPRDRASSVEVRQQALRPGTKASAEAEVVSGGLLFLAAIADLDFEIGVREEPSRQGLIDIVGNHLLIANAARQKGRRQTVLCVVLKGNEKMTAGIRKEPALDLEHYRFVARLQPGGKEETYEVIVLLAAANEIGGNRQPRVSGNHRTNPRGSEILDAVAESLRHPPEHAVAAQSPEQSIPGSGELSKRSASR